MGVGGQRHAPAALTRERPGTHCTGGWVGPRTGLEGCCKSHSHQDLIPGPSSPKQVTSYINHNSFINKGKDSAQPGFIEVIQIFENFSVVRHVSTHSLSCAHTHTYSYSRHSFITLTSCKPNVKPNHILTLPYFLPYKQEMELNSCTK